MMKKQFEQYLSRRILGDNGFQYFCRICGEYKPENEFYKSKEGMWKIDTKCKIHYTRKEIDDDDEMSYLKLNPLKEQDFINTQIFLEKLGYDFSKGISVHDQFVKKHKLNKK
jgi:hypothetical protein